MPRRATLPPQTLLLWLSWQHESRRATGTGRAIEGGMANQKNTRYGETPGHSAARVVHKPLGLLVRHADKPRLQFL
jgi:hypothetical protein